MNEALREQVKARLAELRERFGEHDPDVALFTAFVESTEQEDVRRLVDELEEAERQQMLMAQTDAAMTSALCDCRHTAAEHEEIPMRDGSTWPHGRGTCRACIAPAYCLRFFPDERRTETTAHD